MEWSDEAIVLSLKAHGESSGILEALTRDHGRHLGLVRGGGASKGRAMLQPGNRVKVTWRARLSEHLGVYTVELARARASDMFEHRAALCGLNALSAVAGAVLPEREPHEAAYEGADALLETIAAHDFADWAPLFVHWEIGLLNELGFGLDLARCAATGLADDLIYVSPRTGRAVSREGGEPYRDRLLALPAFLLGRQAGEASPGDLLAGLTLTAHFLEQWVLTPHAKTMPEARVRLTDLAVRSCAKVQ
ncbi:MAG TPA: DNA repair protein RecO [Micropepsaceae bacterium]|nr:DNA repair protein RecO [Micropepsaceae bacterium]